MFNLYEILRSAQGGQAIHNLAAQFNLKPEEADAAVKAVMPALSEGFLKRASYPAEAGSILGALGEGQHVAAFTDPAAAQEPVTAQKGADVLNRLVGSQSACEEIALRASSATGISPGILTQMLPVIASMIFGGITKSLENQGLGGIAGQLTKAAGQGGLGSVLGQILGSGRNLADPPQALAVGEGQLGGLLGSILGNLVGWRGAGSAPGSAIPNAGSPPVQGIDAATIRAGFDALTKLLQRGTAPPAGPEQGGVEAEINDIMSRKRH